MPMMSFRSAQTFGGQELEDIVAESEFMPMKIAKVSSAP